MFPLHNNLTIIVMAYGIQISQYNSTGSWSYSEGHVYRQRSDVRPTGTTPGARHRIYMVSNEYSHLFSGALMPEEK
jgi:hypothetical protein